MPWLRRGRLNQLPQRELVVVVLLVAGDVLNDLDEGREFHLVAFLDALEFQNLHTQLGLNVGVELEVAVLPHEALAHLADGLAGRVGKLQQVHILLCGDAALGLDLFVAAHGLLDGLEIDVAALPAAFAHAHLGAGLAQQVGLGDLALGIVGNVARDLDNVFVFLLDGTGS